MARLEAPDFKTKQELEEFLSKHGENAFIEAHRKMASNAVKRIWNQLIETKVGLQEDDLVNFGLFEVVWNQRDGWHDDGGQSWHSYIYDRMRWRMLDLIRVTSRDPRLLVNKIGMIRDTVTALQFELGRMPVSEEIAARIGITVDEYFAILMDYRGREWLQMTERKKKEDEQSYDGEGMGQASWNEVDRPGRALDPAERLPLVEQVMTVLRRTGEHWNRVVFFMYYFLGVTMKEIGACIDLSESRVSQAMSGICSELARNHVDFELTGRRFESTQAVDPYQTGMRQLWDLLPLDVQWQIVEELNLCTFALRSPKKVRDYKRTLIFDLPKGFVASKPLINVGGRGVMCVLVKNEAAEATEPPALVHAVA